MTSHSPALAWLSLFALVTLPAAAQSSAPEGALENKLTAKSDALYASAQKSKISIDILGGRRKSIWGYQEYAPSHVAESEFIGSEKTLALHFSPFDAPVSLGMVVMKTAYDIGGLTDAQMNSLIGKAMDTDLDTRPLSIYKSTSNTTCNGMEFGPEIKIWSKWLIYEPYLRTSLLWGQYHIDKRAHANTIADTRLTNATDFHEKEDMAGWALRLAPGIAFCPLRELHVLVEYAWSMMSIQRRTTSMSYQHRNNDDTLLDVQLSGSPTNSDTRRTIPTHTFSTGVAFSF